MRRLLAGAVIALMFVTAGCNRANSKASIKAAIQKHLDQNRHLMLNTMSTQFEKVDLHGDTANALVKFQSKNNPKLAVEVGYSLKKINGEWQVISSSSSRGEVSNPANPHAGMTLDQAPPPEGAPGPMPSH